MPEYLFKCNKCGHEFSEVLTFSQLDEKVVTKCQFCFCNIYKDNQLINFSGCINMNSSAVGVAKRKYSNKNGGPTAIVNGKNTGKRAKW